MFTVLFLLWLIFNGRVTLEIMCIGLALDALILLFLKYAAGFSFAADRRLVRRLFLYLSYLRLLVVEIVKANFRMISIVLDKRRPVTQTLSHFAVDLSTDAARALLANAITLTPGTITVSVEENRFTVHCLSREMLDGIQSGGFVRLLQQMEAER